MDCEWRTLRMRRLGSCSLKTPPCTFPSAPWHCTPRLSSLILGISSWRLGSLLPGLVRPECESLGVLQGSMAWLLWLHLEIPSNLVRPLLDPDSYFWIGIITKAVIVLVIMLWELLPFLWPLKPTFQTPLSVLEWPVLGSRGHSLASLGLEWCQLKMVAESGLEWWGSHCWHLCHGRPGAGLSFPGGQVMLAAL